MKRVWRSCESKVVAHKQGWKCATCTVSLPPSFELDHITPLHLGGSNDLDNSQALCGSCHATKTQKERIARLRPRPTDYSPAAPPPVLVLVKPEQGKHENVVQVSANELLEMFAFRPLPIPPSLPPPASSATASLPPTPPREEDHVNEVTRAAARARRDGVSPRFTEAELAIFDDLGDGVDGGGGGPDRLRNTGDACDTTAELWASIANDLYTGWAGVYSSTGSISERWLSIAA